MKHHFPGLRDDRTAAGSLRWRVRVEGRPDKKIRIPMGPGEAGFHEHYAAARHGEKLSTSKPPKAKTGTLDAMCDAFLLWMTAQVKAGLYDSKTLASRRTGLKQACDTRDPDGDRMGSLDADLPREAFVFIADGFGERTGAATTCLKALKAAYRWGEDRTYPRDSPVFRVKAQHKSGGGAVPWTADDVKTYLMNYGPGTMGRLWFCLAYATHSRIGDAPTLGSSNEAYHDGVQFIEWQPSKKGSAFVSIPMETILAEELNNHEARATYLVTEHGRPFKSSGSLDNRVRKWIIAAGLSEVVVDEAHKVVLDDKGKPRVRATRSQHGIRKGVAELMAESGATEYELMSSFGWTEAKTASVYTKKFQRRGGAVSASKRMAEAAKAATKTE